MTDDRRLISFSKVCSHPIDLRMRTASTCLLYTSPKVFCRNPLQQVDTALLRLFGTKAGHEIADNLVVAAGSYQYSGNHILIQLVPAGKSLSLIHI